MPDIAALLACLEELIGPPERAVQPVDWGALERHLGLRFPRDYRALYTRHPWLVIGQHWLINHPTMLVGRDGLRQVNETLFRVDTLERRARKWGYTNHIVATGDIERRAPFPFYPEVPGLLRWGNYDDCDGLMWLTAPDPDDWTIVITDDDRSWQYHGCLIEFMIGMLSGDLDCPLIPRGWVDLAVREYTGERKQIGVNGERIRPRTFLPKTFQRPLAT